MYIYIYKYVRKKQLRMCICGSVGARARAWFAVGQDWKRDGSVRATIKGWRWRKIRAEELWTGGETGERTGIAKRGGPSVLPPPYTPPTHTGTIVRREHRTTIDCDEKTGAPPILIRTAGSRKNVVFYSQNRFLKIYFEHWPILINIMPLIILFSLSPKKMSKH